MTVSAIEATPGRTGTAGTPGAPTRRHDRTTHGTGTSADKDMFLQLMVAQMRYQDP